MLADALIARGDPQGEMIALQLAGADPARVHALTAAHGAAWIAPLVPLAARVQLARGLPARLELVGTWSLTGDGWTAARAVPELATIEDLLPGRASGEVYATMLGSPHLTALRGVEIFDAASAAAVGALPARIDRLAVRGDGVRAVGQLRAALAPRPEIRELAIHAGAFGAIGDLVPQLTTLALGGALAPSLARWSQMPAGTALACRSSVELAPCRKGATFTFEVRLARRADGVVAQVSGMAIAALEATPELLPAEVTHLALVGPRTPALVRLELAARERGIEVASRPAPTPLPCVVVK